MVGDERRLEQTAVRADPREVTTVVEIEVVGATAGPVEDPQPDILGGDGEHLTPRAVGEDDVPQQPDLIAL